MFYEISLNFKDFNDNISTSYLATFPENLAAFVFRCHSFIFRLAQFVLRVKNERFQRILGLLLLSADAILLVQLQNAAKYETK